MGNDKASAHRLRGKTEFVLSAKSISLLGRKESVRQKTKGSTTNRTNHMNEKAEVFLFVLFALFVVKNS